MFEGGGGRGDGADKAREEFLGEVQELVDGLGKGLLELEAGLKRGKVDPEIVDDIFRAVHTLKGLSGLFGATRMSGLSHELEDVLDDLRLGRVELTPRVLDVLFQAVTLYGGILGAERGDMPDPAAEVDQLLVALGHLSHKRTVGGAGVVSQYDLDPSLLGVLTEYEEHRLRTNIQQGQSLYRIRVRLSLATIDSALDDLKAKARPHGEILTYLPTGSGEDIDAIELEILLASRASLGLLQSSITGPDVIVEEVRRRTGSEARASSVPAPMSAPALHDSFPSRDVRQHGGLPVPSETGPTPGDGVDEPSAPVRPSSPATVSLARGPENPIGGARSSGELSLRSVSQTVRVDIRKLDRLMTIVGELAIVRTAIARVVDRARARSTGPQELGVELERLNRTFERQLAQMQNGILEVRMVPLGQAFDKLARVLRQISREHGKDVNLVVTGAETEIDKLIVEELSDPLMHMIRNAVDHGIEARDKRLAVGKPPIGTVALNAFQKGNHVVIEVEDDGRGIDAEALREVAVRRGVVTPAEAAELSPREVLGLVFMPGFTTREVATDLSGRGMGLDVVRTNIAKVGGVVDITSDLGIGTKITITLPITLAIINVLLIEVGARLFAIPLAAVEEAIALDEAQVHSVESREVLTVRGASLPLCRLARLFGIAGGSGRRTRAFVVIAQLGDRRLGIVVDELVGQQDIVIKPLGRSLHSLGTFAGATELGDQRVALVLDAASLIQEVLDANESRFLVHAVEGRG